MGSTLHDKTMLIFQHARYKDSKQRRKLCPTGNRTHDISVWNRAGYYCTIEAMLYVSIEFEGGYITHIAQSSPIMVDDNVRICVSDWGFEAETGGHTDGRTSDRFYEVSLTELTQKLHDWNHKITSNIWTRELCLIFCSHKQGRAF